MAFSYGQSFFQDLLHYSDKHAQDNKELETTFALQSRAADFFKNNPFPILYKSQRYSGMMNNEGEKNPLGGPINRLVSGTNNLPGTGICSDEFDFWGKNPVPSHNEEKQNVIIESYTNTPNTPIKENLTEKFNEDDTWWIILVIVIALLVVLGGLYLYAKKPNMM